MFPLPACASFALSPVRLRLANRSLPQIRTASLALRPRYDFKLFSRSAATANPALRSPIQAKRRTPFILLLSASSLLLGMTIYYTFTPTAIDQKLSPDHFIPLTLSKVERINDETSIFTLDLPTSALPDGKERANWAPVSSLYIVQPELQIQRPYTPLSFRPFDSASSGARGVRLLVKRYRGGETSSWLHRCAVGEPVFVRGPIPTWLIPSDMEQISFVRSYRFLSMIGSH